MRISLIGLGWLGLPLARFLQEKGYHVKGSTTSSEKAGRLGREGVKAFPLLFNPYPKGDVKHLFLHAEVLLVNIPPKINTSPRNFHLQQIKCIQSLAVKAGIKKIIYISSTSVYPGLSQMAYESDKLSLLHTGNQDLLRAENVLWEEGNYDLTVIRFGGLFGDDRIPGRYFSNKRDVDGNIPVNYIHREDAVRLVHWILSHQLWNQTFNGVAPLHPSRKEIYQNNARNWNFDPPLSYRVSGHNIGRIISSEKIRRTGFKFIFDDPMNFLYKLL